VKEEDLILTLLFTIGILVFFIKNYWKIIFIIFDKETAEASGLNVYKLERWILTLTGIAIVLTSKLVGIILSSALIIIPAATVIPFIKDIKKSVFATISLNLISIFSGLIFSYYFNIPTGATIVMVATIFFLKLAFYKEAHKSLTTLLPFQKSSLAKFLLSPQKQPRWDLLKRQV